MGILEDLFQIPTPPSKEWGLLLGILDFFLFGIGTIILGILCGNIFCIIAGILQLCIPFVGWLWSIIWGILIIQKAGWF